MNILTGTWKSRPAEVGSAVELALQVGYTSIDTAAGYGGSASLQTERTLFPKDTGMK